MITREMFLSRKKAKPEAVPVEGFDEPLFIAGMSGAARDALLAVVTNKTGEIDRAWYRVELVGRCLVDEEGVRLFADDEIRSTLAPVLDPETLDALTPVAQRLSGLDSEADEDAEKN